ncbi:TapB family protein [Larkinella sp. GY13]|uniref:TapB family protein n=1 Tax=Larkinella sp. GY13 TaxID=3453720 RepID=UPI003EEA319D
MKTLLFFFAFSLIAILANAQECLGIKFKPGTSYEMLSYSAKDKPTGRVVYTIKEVTSEGGSTLIHIVMQSFDDKGKPAPEMAVKYTCTGDELIADLSGVVLATNDAMKDMEVRIKTNKLVYPKQLSAGSTLADGELEAETYNKDTKMMDMSIKVVNRKVESKESLTTPAGTFDVYKIGSDINLANRMMGIPVRVSFRSVSYRATDVLFDIKTETYNKNGKLKGYTVLSKLSDK